MPEVVFGPYFTKSAPARILDDELEPVGVRLEFASPRHSLTAPIYLRPRDNYNFGLGDYYLPADSISWRIVYRPYFSKQVNGILLLPLDDVLKSIYTTFKNAAPLLPALTEFREYLPPVFTRRGALKSHPHDLLKPEVAAAGIRVADYFSYGRSLDVSFKWMPKKDFQNAESPVETTLGLVEFLGQKDGTLSRGKWRGARSEHIGDFARKELSRFIRVPPMSLFTPEGAEFTYSQFKWQPVHLMSPKELKQARINFIKEHRELWADPKALAYALQDAKLYQKETDIYHIRRSIPKLLQEAGAIENANRSA